MKTKIIIKKGWEQIAEYPFLLQMSKGDVVTWDNREFRVDCLVLNIEEESMEILVG